MLSRKTTTLFCLCFFLAAIASAAVVGPPRRRTDIASTPGSSQQQRSDHVYEEGSEHEVSPTSGHVLIPRNSGQSNGQSDGQSNEQSSGQTNEQPENPERQDETDITEERLPESIPPGLGPESPFPGSRGSSYSVPATPNAEDDIEYSRGQSNRQSNDVQLSPGTMDNIAESRVARRSLIFKSLGLAIIYGDYVDRIKFLVAVPNENVIYQCWGGINMITPITEFPTFTPCRSVDSGVSDTMNQGTVSFALKSTRVRAPLTAQDPVEIYVKYQNIAESESWTLPVSIDDSNVQLVSEIPEARQYRYGMTRETVFQARGQAAKNK